MGILLIALVLSGYQGFSQKQTNVWLFCDSLMLDFNTGQGKIVQDFKSALFSGLNISNICDKDGRLQAYTNNNKIYNREHRVMKNGDSLKLSTYSFYTTMFVPQPGHRGRYVYLFTSGAGDYGYNPSLPLASALRFYPFHYSVIDMEGDGGLGEVVVKNQYLFETPAETMTACLHANGHDVWVAAYDFVNHDIYLYLLTVKGITVKKRVDLSEWEKYALAYTGKHNSGFHLRFSPTGNGLTLTVNSAPFWAYLDFDNLSGEFGQEQVIETGKYGLRCYATEFSANGKFIYFSGNWLDPGPHSALLQQEVTKPIKWAPAVIDSSLMGTKYIGAQLGPDKRIYVTIVGLVKNMLVINAPDKKGQDCDLQENQVTSNKVLNSYTIPIMPPIFNCQLDVGSDTTICVGERKSIKVEGYPQNFRWSDGSTGNELLIDRPGTYWVRLQSEYCDYLDSIVIREKTPPRLDLEASYQVCGGSEVVIDPGSADTYSWSNGSRERFLKTGESGVYSVKATNECGTSEAKTEIAVRTIEFPNVFTPNGDGLNDAFELLAGAYIPDGKLDVFNRWGKKVFSGENYTGGWTGENEEPGVYYYHYGSKDCLSVKGWVQIIK